MSFQLKNYRPDGKSKSNNKQMIIFIVFVSYQFILSSILQTKTAAARNDLPLEFDSYSIWTDKRECPQDAQCSSTGTEATFENLNTAKSNIKHMNFI